MEVTTDLKRELHHLIDLVNDEQVLNAVHVLLKKESQAEQDFWVSMPEAEKQAICEGMAQLANNEKIPGTDIKNLYKKWL